MAWVDKVGILGCRNSGELLVLIRVGNHVGGDMRGCFTLARTLARECLMGESTVLRHLRRLRAGGILLPGDQNLVDHIRADKRPPVYDLAGGHLQGCPGKHSSDVVCETVMTGTQIGYPLQNRTAGQSEHPRQNSRPAGVQHEHPNSGATCSGAQFDAPRVIRTSGRSNKEVKLLLPPPGQVPVSQPLQALPAEDETENTPLRSAQDTPPAAVPLQRLAPGRAPVDLQLVMDAYLTALGGIYPTRNITQRLLREATELLELNWPVTHIAKLAAELPALGYTSLTRHAEHNLPPLSRRPPSIPLPWCGTCESPEYRWIAPETGPVKRCPTCNPAAPTITSPPAT